MFEPAKWLIQGLAWLPDALRPGVCVALVFALGWLLVRQRVLVPFWHGACRAVAVGLDTVVGLALYPEYRITTARRGHGASPGRIALRVSPIADGLLEGARTLYQRHVHPPLLWRRPPWKTMLAIVVVCAAAWLTMDQVPEESPVKRQLAAVYDVWRDAEAWADVAPARRALAGAAVVPTVESQRRAGGVIRALVVCPAGAYCRGWLTAETATGRMIATRELQLAAGTSRIYRLRLPKRAPKRVEAVFSRVEPTID